MRRRSRIAGIAVVGALVVLGVAVTRWTGGARAPSAAAPRRSRSVATAIPAPVGRGAPAPAEPRDGTLRIEGQVIDAQGRGVGGAEVFVDGEPPRRVETEADGSFVVDRLVRRTYRVSARADDRVAGPAACAASERGDPLVLRLGAGARVTVTVTGDGAPVRGAVVDERVGNARQTARSDARGVAVFSALEPGLAVFEVTAPGYGPATGTAFVGAPGAAAELAIALHRGWQLTGVVVDERGAAIAAAQVTAIAGGRTTLEHTGAATDGSGGFAMTVAPGTYRVRAMDGEHAPAFSPMVTVTAQDAGPIRLVVSDGGTLLGVVQDVAGRPVSGAVIDVFDPEPQLLPHRQTVSDGRGALEVHGLPRRTLQVVAETEGARSDAILVDLAATARARVTLVLDAAATIAGQVVDDHGGAVPEVEVIARPQDATWTRPSVARSAGDGRFVLRGLAEGRYRLSATRRSGAVGDAAAGPGVVVQTGRSDARVVLATPGQLRGRIVVAETGAPPDHATIMVDAQLPVMAHAGAFQIAELVPGPHDVLIQGAGFTDTLRGGVQILAGETTDLGELRVARGRVVTGVVADASGTPMADAAIRLGVLTPSPRAPDDAFGALVPIKEARSGADGTFTIAGVPRRPTSIAAHDPERGLSAVVAVPAAGDPVPVRLVLPARTSR
jgi:hypothetical protein